MLPFDLQVTRTIQLTKTQTYQYSVFLFATGITQFSHFDSTLRSFLSTVRTGRIRKSFSFSLSVQKVTHLYIVVDSFLFSIKKHISNDEQFLLVGKIVVNKRKNYYCKLNLRQ